MTLDTRVNLISTDAIEIRAYEDLIARPNFVCDVNPTKVALVRVLNEYHFGDSVRCGLTSCHQPHHHGYLIETDDGHETNIGNDCGRTHFGENLVTQVRLHRGREELRQQQALLATTIARKPEILARIRELRERRNGADWLVRARRQLKDAVGTAVIVELQNRAKRGDLAVVEERQRSSQQIADILAANPSLRRQEVEFEQVTQGYLHDVGFINSYPELQLNDLQNKMHELTSLDFSRLSVPKRLEWVKWINGIDREFEEVEDKLAEAIRFIDPSNFNLLAYLPKRDAERRKAIARRDRRWRVPKLET
ncbi:MAG: hypothetical protein J0H09_15685 [Burkholderiales bacterium]|nr:hypothetical protein [Burkholderiales bacterium]ODU71583.1 MAG: hypothetical protein ABT05_01010 [Lautropia sp. SCN 66-9]